MLGFGLEQMKLPSNRPEDLLPEYKEAYDAMPECYRADSCLTFYVDKGMLFADYDLGGLFGWHAERKVWFGFKKPNGFDVPKRTSSYYED
jgi:hypothetical protein